MKRLCALLLILPVSAWAQSPPQTPATTDDTSFGSPCAYPQTALNAHSEGLTQLSYRGTDDGRIEDVKVAKSSGHADLDDAAVECVSRWRFDPNVEKSRIGMHEAGAPSGISWQIPDAAPGAPPPAGKWVNIGRPHVCFQDYPIAEKRAGIEGTTVLRFTITDEGDVRDEAVDQSSGNTNLDAAALQCVRTWRYRPPVLDGKPIAVSWKAAVVWKLEVPQPPPFAEPPRDCVHSTPVKAEDLAGISGTTVVTFRIVEGGVRDASVTDSSGNAALDRAAVACISSRRYVREYVTVNGKDVDKVSSMTVQERLNWNDALKPVSDQQKAD